MQLLIDPCNAPSSGITRYTQLVRQATGCRVLARGRGEPLGWFSLRVMLAARRAQQVEAPSDWAAARYVPAAKLHIRLHGLHALLGQLEGKPFDPALDARERREIARAAQVSAPSRAAHAAVQPFVRCAAAVYANPFPPLEPCGAARDIDVLFLGRAHALKGILFLPAILAALPPGQRVVLAGPGMPAFARAAALAVQTHPAVDDAQRRTLLQRSRVVIVPSFFETFSMVAAEALCAGAQVVCWEGAGIAEYAAPPYLTTVPRWQADRFARAILAAQEAAPATGWQPPAFAPSQAVRYAAADMAEPLMLPPVAMQYGGWLDFRRRAMPQDARRRKWRKLLRSPLRFAADALRR